MGKGITLEIPEAEAANLEAGLDELLSELRKLDQQPDPTWEVIDRLKAETHLMIQQIRATLNVEKLYEVLKRLFVLTQTSRETEKRDR